MPVSVNSPPNSACFGLSLSNAFESFFFYCFEYIIVTCRVSPIGTYSAILEAQLVLLHLGIVIDFKNQ